MIRREQFKVILFDLGKTLIYPLYPWQEILIKADSALINSLTESGISPKVPISPSEIQMCLNNYYDQRNINHVELTAKTVLSTFLASRGIHDIDDLILRKALDAMYSVTQSNWSIEKDAIKILDELSITGYKLGLVSNAADDRDVQQLVDTWGLRKYFQLILTSAESGWRKPHSFMFQKALDFFEVLPDHTAMVGDTLLEDIEGAQLLGIYGIWITRRAQMPPDGELDIQPHAIISSLGELPQLLNDISIEG